MPMFRMRYDTIVISYIRVVQNCDLFRKWDFTTIYAIFNFLHYDFFIDWCFLCFFFFFKKVAKRYIFAWAGVPHFFLNGSGNFQNNVADEVHRMQMKCTCTKRKRIICHLDDVNSTSLWFAKTYMYTLTRNTTVLERVINGRLTLCNWKLKHGQKQPIRIYGAFSNIYGVSKHCRVACLYWIILSSSFCFYLTSWRSFVPQINWL